MVTQRNGLQWQTMILTNLVKEVNILLLSFLNINICHECEGGMEKYIRLTNSNPEGGIFLSYPNTVNREHGGRVLD